MVDEGYFELSAEGGSDKSVSVEEVACDLDDCPYCGNPMLGHCRCGKWLCLNPEHMDYVKCPASMATMAATSTRSMAVWGEITAWASAFRNAFGCFRA